MALYKVIVEKHPDVYVAYPLGLKGVVVGEAARTKRLSMTLSRQSVSISRRSAQTLSRLIRH